MKEIPFQSRLINGFEACGGYSFKCNNRFKVGIHDLWVGLPNVPGFFVECKVMRVPDRTIELLDGGHAMSVPKEHRPSPMQVEFERKVRTRSGTKCVGLALVNDCRMAMMRTVEGVDSPTKWGDLMRQLSVHHEYYTGKNISWKSVAHIVGLIMRGWYEREE